MEISDATEWYEVWRTLDLLYTRPYYDLRTVISDVEVLTPGAAFHEDSNRWLIPSSASDLDRGYVRWERVRSIPERLIVRGLWWLGYWPIIGSATGTVKQYATALPPAMEDDDTPGFPEAFHLGLVEFGLSELLPQIGEVQKALEAWDAYVGYEAGLQAYVGGRGAVPLMQGYGENAGSRTR